MDETRFCADCKRKGIKTRLRVNTFRKPNCDWCPKCDGPMQKGEAMESEYYIPSVTPVQKEYLSRYVVTLWDDNSVNVRVRQDQVDAFVDWCETQGFDAKLL